jgi:hypothetical protein
MVMKVPPQAMQTPRASNEGSGRVAGKAGLAQRRATILTRTAVTAAGYKGGDNVITHGEVRDPGSQFLHHTGSLVAQHHRYRTWPVAIDD